MLKKLLLVFFLSIPFIIFGQTFEDFNSTADFTITMSELQQIAAGGDPDALPARFVIIDGAVESRVLVNSNTAEYLAELVLVGGEWIGVETVVRFQSILQLIGPEFSKAVPARRSRTPNPAEIVLNSRILVVAKATGLRQLADGTYIPVLRVYSVRKIS
ncbi:MAG: hypothetical protein HN368_23125 [Spirochaetales bacterium]|jgi:hypothetical protein|nr:hypothetical protein [Spirochaetales bacterium]